MSAAIFALWLCSLVVRAIRAVAARRPAAKPKASAAAPSQQQQHAAAPSQQQQRAPKKDLKALIKEAERAKRAAAAREDPATHHPLFVAALKGHTDAVGFVSWSRDGRRLATACEDLAVRVFEIGGSSSGGGSGGGAKAEPKLVATVRTQQAPLACGFGNADGEVVAVLRGAPFGGCLGGWVGGSSEKFVEMHKAGSVNDRVSLSCSTNHRRRRRRHHHTQQTSPTRRASRSSRRRPAAARRAAAPRTRRAGRVRAQEVRGAGAKGHTGRWEEGL